MLVILDHGDGYMTLYGGNRDVAVQKEDWVQTGATIATVGDSGGQKTSEKSVDCQLNHRSFTTLGKGDCQKEIGLQARNQLVFGANYNECEIKTAYHGAARHIAWCIVNPWPGSLGHAKCQ